MTPVYDNLFQANDNARSLDTDKADYFQRMTAQLLFISKRACPDIQVVIVFFCTRVKRPNMKDYRRLNWVIKYLRGIIHLPLLVGWDETGVVTWNVNAVFTVHKDMGIHIDSLLTMGSGLVISLSLKQNINIKSPTEVEVVGVDDVINFVVWTKMYFDWQTQMLSYRIIQYSWKYMEKGQVQYKQDTLIPCIFLCHQ